MGILGSDVQHQRSADLDFGQGCLGLQKCMVDHLGAIGIFYHYSRPRPAFRHIAPPYLVMTQNVPFRMDQRRTLGHGRCCIKHGRQFHQLNFDFPQGLLRRGQSICGNRNEHIVHRTH